MDFSHSGQRRRIGGLLALCWIPVALATAEDPPAATSTTTTNRISAGEVVFAVGSLPLRDLSKPGAAGRPPTPATDRTAPEASSEASAPSPASTVEAAELSSVEVAVRNLGPRQRAELEALAASLPRYRAEAFDDGLLTKAGAVLFPEFSVIKVGKVSVAGGLITAVKTRNPFGLLNPLILGIGW